MGDVIAQRYIVSSSVSFITQSFSSGSTIFGDTLDDTHQFTGSLSITGSSITAERTPLVITADGEVQVADADFITSGDVGAYELDISSSGDNDGITITNNEVLIISGAGGLDVTADTNTLTFTIGNGILSSSNQIADDISGSFLLNTTDEFTGKLTVTGDISASGDITASGTIIADNNIGTRNNFILFNASGTTLDGLSLPNSNTVRVGGFNNSRVQIARHTSDGAGGVLATFEQDYSLNVSSSISAGNHITASGHISASGHLFASLSLDNNNHKTVMYDTSSGQFFFTGSYGGDGGGGFTLIRLNGDNGTEVINDGDTITIAGGTNINTIAGSTDTVTVNLNHSISLSGSGLFLSGGQHDYGNQTDIDATSGFRVDNDKAYTHITPQFYRDKYAILGVPFKARFSVAEFPNNYLVMGPHGIFVNSGHSGTDPTVDEPGKALIVGGGDNAGVGVIQVRGDLEIVPTQSVDGGTTSGIRIAAGNPTGSFNPGIFFYDRDNTSTVSGSLFYSSASAEIRFDTGSKSVKFLAGSTTEDLKEVLHVSKSGDNPRIGIGLSNPIKAFDFKEVRDDNKGGEILIRGSRSTKGAENNDEVGRINFAIDSASFGKIDTSGSAAEIVAIVDDIDPTGVEGSLSLRVAGSKTEGSVQRIKLIGSPNSPAVEITGSTEFDTDVTIGDDLTVSDFALLNAVRIGSTATDPGDGVLHVEDYGVFVGGLKVGSSEDPGANNLIVDGTTTLKGITNIGNATGDTLIVSGSNVDFPSVVNKSTVSTTDNILILEGDRIKKTPQTGLPYISIQDGVIPGGNSNELLMFSGSTGTKKVKVAPGVTHNAALGYVFSGAGTTTDIFAGNVFIGLITASGNISASGTIVGSNLSGTNTGDQNISNLAITGSNVIFANITASGNISASGDIIAHSASFTGPVKISLATEGTALEITEEDEDQKGRLLFEYDDGNPTLTIASRASTAKLHIRQDAGTNGLYFDEDGQIYVNNSTQDGVKIEGTSFHSVGTNANALDLGKQNRPWKDLYLTGDGANIFFQDNTTSPELTLNYPANSNRLILSASDGHPTASFEVEGNISASGLISAATLDAAAVSDTLAAAIVAEIDNDEIPIAKLAEDAVTVTAGTGLSGGGSVTLGGSITINSDGLLSSSAQIASDISGSFTATSASLAADIVTNAGNIGTTTNALTVDNATLQLNSGTTFNGSAARTISIKDGGVDSDALAANILVTQLTSSIISASSTVTANSFTGNGLSIDGSSNSHIEVGEYNVGFDTVASNTVFITGSGLIVSGAMADQNHHNMVKIGNVELLDVNTLLSQNEFLIHNVSSFKITSGSDGGDIAGTAGRLFEHNGTDFKLYRNNSEVIGVDATTTTFNNTNVSFVATPFFRAAVTDPSSNGHFLYTVAAPGSSPQETKAVNVGDVFKVLTGAVTASAVSASGTITGNSIVGTLGTAAQTNITSVGTLSSLTVSGDITANGNIVGDDATDITNIESIFADNLVHDGDTDTKIAFGTNTVQVDAGGTTVFESSITGSVLPNVHQNILDTGSLALTANSAIGDIVKFGNSSTVAGGIYYLNSSGGWSLAQANAGGTATSSLAVAVGTNSTTHGMCLRGLVNPFSDPGAGIGNPVYLNDTNQGRFTATAPSSAGDVVRILGHQFGTDLIYFNPSNDFIIHA